MRLLTNLCATLSFTPWPSSTAPTPSTTASSLATLHPYTLQSLLLHLHAYPTPTPTAAALTKLDLLISALHPTLNLISNPLISSEHSVQALPAAGGITRPLTVQPDLAIYQSHHHHHHHHHSPLPLTSFVTTPCQPFPDNTYIRSPSALAACYNDIFSDERFADPARTDVREIRQIMRMVARAVSAALCTETGCAGFTDGRVAVLLRVHPEDNGKVCVQVSRAFDEDAAVAFAGLVEWSKECGSRQKSVRECIVRIGNAKTKFWFDVMGRVRIRRWMGGFVEGLLKGCVGVAGVGDCGVVLESVWNGRPVAVKYWNEGCAEGLEELLDEIRVYRMLVERFPHVVGKIVPKLIYCRVEAGEAVLVTEYVGRGLTRQGEKLLIGDDGKRWDELEQDDERKIAQAAKESLLRLHECGVGHGDVCLSNLRVERMCDCSWVAWWIDLAHAEDIFEHPTAVHVDRLQLDELIA